MKGFKGSTPLLLLLLAACPGDREGAGGVPEQAPEQVGPQETAIEAVGGGEISGQVRVTATQDGGSEVHVSVTGAEPNMHLSARLHEGSCEAQGEVVSYLTGMTLDGAGQASSTTRISSPPGRIGDGAHVVVIFAGLMGQSQEVLACAQVPRGSPAR